MISRVFYRLVQNVFMLFFRLYNRLEVYGLSNIPSEGPMIVASNHASFADPPLIGAVFPIRLRYLAKESLFRVPLLGFLIRTLGAVPVTRGDSQRAGAVMKLLLALLKEGESVLLFPEGSRSANGRLGPIEPGAAYLSVKTGFPVLPVYVKGSFEAWPKSRALPRPSKMKLTISHLIYPDPDMPNERERREKLMRSLERELLAMEDADDVC
ncbi:MAG: 1-acyl-sn-glycerol-3-phosphate acyltransferase [Synergistaceae bacterium]|jgi:1-acyl-sn-glycerol-3-phosphate acyltransferase|nr:1-acyl-sn-glycerol-3-phosphate acyltransferase [Synergistaceae bacterium]